jgi:hypothetical protein
VVVGSINKFNNWNTTIDKLDDKSAEMILNRCADQLCPTLRNAKILNQWIGLRPFRQGGVRLEHEVVICKNRTKMNVRTVLVLWPEDLKCSILGSPPPPYFLCAHF